MIRADDIEKGQYLAILKNPSISKDVADGEGFVKTIVEENHKYKGAVLKVESVMLPYIVCSIYWGGTNSKIDFLNGFKDSFDTRTHQFMKVTDEYRKALEIEA